MMMMRPAVALCLLMAAACTPREADDTTSQTNAAAASAPSAAVEPASPSPTPQSPANALPAAELSGEYRVAGVDGGDINLPHAITASIGDGRIRAAAGCVEAAWRYTYANGRLATIREPVAGCERGLHPKEEAVFAAFDAATRVTRTPANGIELSGGGRSVTLFSQ